MTDPLRFSKLQGAGNDFVLIDGTRGSGRDWSALAVTMCDRHFGVGADGLLVLLPSDRADVRMRMFNRDGTEDDCGNGLRCAALYARRRGLVDRPEFRVESLSGVKRARVPDHPPTGGAAAPGDLSVAGGGAVEVTIDLGRAELAPAAVPVVHDGDHALGMALEVDGENLEVHSLSTGTAHTVIFEMPDEARFQRLSPLLEHHPAYPERTSVLWTEMTGPNQARVRIWERGVGETLACGTGASAVALAAHRSGRSGNQVAVTSRGGTLAIELGTDLSIRLSGPAAFVYEGEWTGPHSG